MSIYKTAGGLLGGTAGGAAGAGLGQASSLLDILKPLDYPRQSAYNLVRSGSRALTGEADWDDLAAAIPGLLGLGVGAAFGGPLGALAAGAAQGVGNLADEDIFAASTPADLVGMMGGDPESFLQTMAAGVATDPLTYTGFGAGHKLGAGIGDSLAGGPALRSAAAKAAWNEAMLADAARSESSAATAAAREAALESERAVQRGLDNPLLEQMIGEQGAAQEAAILAERMAPHRVPYEGPMPGLGPLDPTTGQPIPYGERAAELYKARESRLLPILEDAKIDLESGRLSPEQFESMQARNQPDMQRIQQVARSSVYPPVGQVRRFGEEVPRPAMLEAMTKGQDIGKDRLRNWIAEMTPEQQMRMLNRLMDNEVRLGLRKTIRPDVSGHEALSDVLYRLSSSLEEETLPGYVRQIMQRTGIDPDAYAIADAQAIATGSSLRNQRLLAQRLSNSGGIPEIGGNEGDIIARQLMADISELDPRQAQLLLEGVEPLQRADRFTDLLDRRTSAARWAEERARTAAQAAERANSEIEIATSQLLHRDMPYSNRFPRILREMGIDPEGIVDESLIGAATTNMDLLRKAMAGRVIDPEEMAALRQLEQQLAEYELVDNNNVAVSKILDRLVDPISSPQYFESIMSRNMGL